MPIELLTPPLDQHRTLSTGGFDALERWSRMLLTRLPGRYLGHRDLGQFVSSCVETFESPLFDDTLETATWQTASKKERREPDGPR